MLGSILLIFFVTCAAATFGFPFVSLILHLWYDLAAPQFAFWNHFGDIGISMITGLIVVFSFIFGQRGNLRFTAVSVSLILFVFWFCLTYLQAIEPVAAAHKFDRAIKSIPAVAVCMLMLTTRRRIELLLLMYLSVVCLFGIRAGLVTLVTGGGYGVDISGNVAGSVLFESSTFSVALITSIPLLAYVGNHSLFFKASARFRWIFIFAGIFNLIGVLGTQARAGLVAAAAMVLVALFMLPNKFRNLLAVFLVSLTGIVLAPDSWFERMATMGSYSADGSAVGRLEAWKYAWNLANTRFLGGGFGAFNLNVVTNDVLSSLPKIVESHSWFFEALGEQGYVGCALLTFVFGSSLVAASKSAFAPKIGPEALEWQRHLGRALLLSVAALIAGGLFIGIASHTFTYILPALCSGLISCRARSKIVVPANLIKFQKSAVK